jgi:hypothetical protein
VAEGEVAALELRRFRSRAAATAAAGVVASETPAIALALAPAPAAPLAAVAAFRDGVDDEDDDEVSWEMLLKPLAAILAPFLLEAPRDLVASAAV